MSDPHPLSEYDLPTLAGQFACPHGEPAGLIAGVLAQSNRPMIEHAIDCLPLQPGQRVLEMGHGGAGHLDYLLARQSDIHYSGLEISAAMHELAAAGQQRDNTAFYLYDGTHFPAFTAPFDHAFSVNTLYFWQQPVALLRAVYDNLRPGGYFALGYGTKAFMATLPFVAYGFTLYDEAEVEALVAKTPFVLYRHHYAADHSTDKNGDPVTRHFCTTVLYKG